MNAATDWESIAGALPVVLWILFLALRRRKQAQTHVDDDDDEPATPPRRGRRLRHDESPEFQRNYDPIEPS